MLFSILQCLVLPECALAKDTVAPEKNAAAKKESSMETVTRVPISQLPASVQDMREAILAAVARGDIEEMRIALEWNELRPALGFARDEDAIEAWRRVSDDGKGLEILAILGEILEGAPVRLPIGRDVENNDVFVWPYLSELALDKLTDRQKIDLYRLVPPETAKEIIMTGKWTWYRLAIGADGTWHVFAKD